MELWAINVSNNTIEISNYSTNLHVLLVEFLTLQPSTYPSWRGSVCLHNSCRHIEMHRE